VRLREVAVDRVHFHQLVVGNIGFGKQYVHVSGHASSDRVDSEAYIDTTFGEGVIQLANFVLRLRDSHAVAGNDGDAAGSGKNRSSLLGRGALDGLGLLLARGGGLNLSEAAEQNVGKRAVHRFGHDYGKDKTGRAVERPGDDQQLA